MSKAAIILGVDPGLSGGCAILDVDARLIDAYHFPLRAVRKSGKESLVLDTKRLVDLWRDTKAVHAFVENVSSRPRQAGQFQFGVNTGVLHGILAALGVEMTLVAPAAWKAGVGLQREDEESKREIKTRARQMAASLYPDKAALFERVKDDGPAEATLIAMYGLHLLAKRI